MKYFFFLDETGDHGLNFIDKNFPLFLLCGCLFDEKSLAEIENRLKNLKKELFGTDTVVLHSREIRKCEGPFQVLFDLKLKEKFYSGLNDILNTAKYNIIGSAVQKEEHVKRYGKSASNPYSLSLSFIMERLIFTLNRSDRNAKIEIKVEKRGEKEDKSLLAHYNSILDRGTIYVKAEEFMDKIQRFEFSAKIDNVLGLQIADLCAYPLARHILNPKVKYIPFEVIKDKICCNDKGSIDGWGLKVFP